MTAEFACLYFGRADECPECGGSATRGGTQAAIATDFGRFCSFECATEAEGRAVLAAARRAIDYCPACGYDAHEHAPGCHPTR